MNKKKPNKKHQMIIGAAILLLLCAGLLWFLCRDSSDSLGGLHPDWWGAWESAQNHQNVQDETQNQQNVQNKTENQQNTQDRTQHHRATQENAQGQDMSMEEKWQEAENTPLGRYPTTVTYTLGKISGANNSNMPVGDTYEDNAYTRYLKEVLNIQNKDLFELEDNGSYEEALQITITDRNLPDILVVNGRENLETLVREGLVEDLTDAYENCTTDAIKDMYASFGPDLIGSATFDGRLYAFPNAAIDDGPMLLWLRADWIRELGLEEPETLEEAMDVIHAFVERDVAGDGETIGLACSTDLIASESDTYCIDPVFTRYGSVPKKWILDGNGDVVYGSVTPETRQALGYLHELYEEGILDTRFLLRKRENLDQLVADGKCGAIFGRWWAPNNPLNASYSRDKSAEWKPYLLTEEQENRVTVFESYENCMYVVARKGFRHPELIGKYVSAIFDEVRYRDDPYASQVNESFSINVDPTARPLNINVDYEDGLNRTSDNIKAALNGEKNVTELSRLEKSYYNTCRSFLNGSLTTANGWAAYASRILAADVLDEAEIPQKNQISIDGQIARMPKILREMEEQAFLQIIAGEKPLDYFDTFVVEWYENGGAELTETLKNDYEKIKE